MKMLASATGNHKINLWCLMTHQMLISLSGHADTIWRIAFSPDDCLLASASAGGASKHHVGKWHQQFHLTNNEACEGKPREANRIQPTSLHTEGSRGRHFCCAILRGRKTTGLCFKRLRDSCLESVTKGTVTNS